MCLQNNKVSVWSLGDNGVSNIEGEFDEEPQLLCDSQHDGDVMDLQVSVNNFTVCTTTLQCRDILKT